VEVSNTEISTRNISGIFTCSCKIVHFGVIITIEWSVIMIDDQFVTSWPWDGHYKSILLPADEEIMGSS
jgi:hypothetical protein